MEDTTNDAAPVESDINAPTGDGEAQGQAATAAQDANDDAASPSEKAQPNGPLAAAVAALEGLTEAVELLGDQEPDVAGPRLAELAGELQAVAGALAAAVGAEVPAQEAGGDDGDKADASETEDADLERRPVEPGPRRTGQRLTRRLEDDPSPARSVAGILVGHVCSGVSCRSSGAKQPRRP